MYKNYKNYAKSILEVGLIEIVKFRTISHVTAIVKLPSCERTEPLDYQIIPLTTSGATNSYQGVRGICLIHQCQPCYFRSTSLLDRLVIPTESFVGLLLFAPKMNATSSSRPILKRFIVGSNGEDLLPGAYNDFEKCIQW